MKKTKFSHKVIAVFFTINMFVGILPVNNLFASNNGPNAPEASGFEPVDATDMVNLSTGDTAYVLPLIDVDGFPVTLSYHSGIPLDMESSWVGLGWNLNTGAIARGVSATPDDWSAAKTLDFIYFQDSETFYSINVGVGISSAADVGVGMSWGSNKSLSGSVFGSFMGANASISTDGSYSVGFGVGFGSKGSKTSGVGAGVSVSGNLNGGKPTVGIGVGGRTGNMTGSLGVSLSDSGASFSLSAGFSNSESYGKGQAGGAGISVGNYSSGDFDISSKGFYIPIQIGIFSFGFGKQKVTYTLKKGYDKTGYGILYSGDAYDNDSSINNDITSSHRFNDYQNRYTYADMYDQSLPQSEEDYVADTRPDDMKLNFSYAGYDSYEINATGVMGNVKPKIMENATLFGLGYKGSYPDSGEDKMRVYYHNSKGSSSTSYLPTKSLGNNFYFYFDGQFTQRTEITPLDYTTDFSFNSNSSKTLKDYLPTGRIVDNTRKKSGNYVEVFTNEQIRTNQALGLMEPEGLPHSSRTNSDFIDSGIGGYKVTSPDGKTYHFSLPVYNYERVERTNLQNNSGDYVNEKRQFTPFATHWLLTAITGPDFIDLDNNNFPDENDYGYWVRLDHGQWSNGFTWRSPYSGVNYNTNIKNEIEDGDYGSWQYGRKDLYYLDKIVSQTHTAYFVKDIRYDATGATTNGTNNENNFTYKYDPFGIYTIPDDTGSGGINPYVRENGITYEREYQLVLDKILIVPNKFDNVQKDLGIGDLNTQNLPGYNANHTYQLNYDINGGFYKERNAQPLIKLHQENNVYDVNDFQNFDYTKALKTIQFEYNYELAQNSPSSFQCSLNPEKGRLSLKEIKFLGRDLYDYMPPYKFEYKGAGNTFEYPNGHQSASHTNGEVKKAKDEWGFIDEQYYLREFIENTYGIGPDHENYQGYFDQHYAQFSNSHGPDNWSLSKITMPTGSSINFDYEEDDYYTEAFARRVFDQGVSFQVREDAQGYLLEMKNAVNVVDDLPIDFTDYYKVGDNAWGNLWMHYDESGNGDDGGINFDSKELEVLDVSSNYVKFRMNIIPGVDTHQTYWWKVKDIPWGPVTYQILGQTVTIDGWYYGGHHINKGAQGDTNGPQDHWLFYRILATQVPKHKTGGGLRVKAITLKDDVNNEYKTSYYYNKPGTNKVKNQGDYESSGITSFAPVNGLKYVPYQSELPGAGVMYEYVTMRSESIQGNSLGETRYRFHTLQPVFDIFDPNLTMYDDQNTEIFKATVTNANNDDEGLLHSAQKVYAKKIHLDINTSLVGQFRSIEAFNDRGHLLSKTEKQYLSGAELANYGNRGYVMESFQNMKSVFKTNSDNNNPVLQSRQLSLSSKKEYTSVVSSTKTTTQFGETTETYSNADPETGAFRTTTSKLADGSFIKKDNIPAYTKYPQMGSKVGDASKKHMLTQGALEITSWSQYGSSHSWKTLNAGITTWNDTWDYRDVQGNETTANGVWRKHKSYVWKEAVDPENGTYLTTIVDNNYDDYFDWGLGVPENDNWQKTSEITRYTNWSAPLESQDINGNYMSSKMAEKDSKVIASGNAGFNEMFASGAEYDVDGIYLDQEIKGAQLRSSDEVHTGKYALKLNLGDKGFETILKAGEHAEDNYKISVWVYKGDRNVKININGISKSFNGESVQAGNWTMFNHYDFFKDADLNISVITEGGQSYVDDFRIHPVYSSMNSYVYDENTGELNYILDINNMATKYVYDGAGRLCKLYKEVEADFPETDGGFKLINQYKYNYKGQGNTSGCDCCEGSVQTQSASTSYAPLIVKSLSEIDKGAYKRVFETSVNGGSGDYTYQWRWLTDFDSNTYSNYVTGTNKQEVPFAIKMCDIKANTFNKIWIVELKAIDNITGESITKKEKVEFSDCKSILSETEWADIEISTNYDACNLFTKYTFRPFVVSPVHQDYTYLYQTYDHATSQWSGYNSILTTKNNFCTESYFAPSSECKTAYALYQTIQYRVVDNQTGSIYQSNIMDVYLDCVENPDAGLKLPDSAYHDDHNSFGNVIEKSSTGEIITTYNFTDKINNKN